MDRLLIVGLGEPEAGALRECLSTPVTCYEMLPRIQLRQGQLYVESPRADGRLLPVARVLFHGIFEDDLPFLGALALWGGPCFPNARGMLDCRLRLPCLVRALRVTRFAGLARGYADCGSAFEADVETRADSASARPPPGECPRAGRRPTGQIRQALPPFRPPLIESPHASPRKCSSRETASVPSVEQRRRGRPSPPGIPLSGPPELLATVRDGRFRRPGPAPAALPPRLPVRRKKRGRPGGRPGESGATYFPTWGAEGSRARRTGAKLFNGGTAAGGVVPGRC